MEGAEGVNQEGNTVGARTERGHDKTRVSRHGKPTSGTQAQWVSEQGVGVARSGNLVGGNTTLLSADTFDYLSCVGSMPYVSTCTGEMPHDYLGRSQHPVRV
jgi:hypothetical protein